MDGRYQTEKMARLFTEDYKLSLWLRVEAVLAEVHAELGNIPKDSAKEIAAKANLDHVKLDRVKEIEEIIHHDLMAMVKGLTEVCSEEAGKYIHLGATSYDIEDPALMLLNNQALDVLEESLLKTLGLLLMQAEKTKDLVCIGRTHGQHALPTTYGMRFANWASEFDRHIERLRELRKRVKVGKFSGAVGTMDAFGEKGFEIQKKVMEKLGLSPVLIANQVLQRDRHCEIIMLTALVAATVDKIARQMRILQRNEIGEMFEPFKSTQVGSSAMPHKRNPHKAERLCSLARIVKGNVSVALENVTLEDERDLTNSASERVIFAETFVLLDYMLSQMNSIIENEEFNNESIKRNLDFTNGAIYTAFIMTKLVEKGIGRQEGHELMRNAAIESGKTKKHLREVLKTIPQIKGKLSDEELDHVFNPENNIGSAVKQVENVIAVIRKKHKL